MIENVGQRKRKRSDSVLWQKPLHQQKCQKGKVTTQTTPQKSSIKQRLRTDLGRSVGVTTAIQLVWLTGLSDYIMGIFYLTEKGEIWPIHLSPLKEPEQRIISNHKVIYTRK